MAYGRYLQLRYLKYPKMAFDLVLRFDMAQYSIAYGGKMREVYTGLVVRVKCYIELQVPGCQII